MSDAERFGKILPGQDRTAISLFYHLAVELGRDVDKLRNLAESVTAGT